MNTDQKLAQGKEWLATVLQFAAIEADILATQTDSPVADLRLEIHPRQQAETITQALCTEADHALDALQYLANVTLNLHRQEDEHCAYTIDIAGYRQSRLNQLKVVVDQAVAKVRQTGQPEELHNLTSAERRQIHALIDADYPDLNGHSHGYEPHRYLVLSLRSSHRYSENLTSYR